jgi:hypothetical protein
MRAEPRQLVDSSSRFISNSIRFNYAHSLNYKVQGMKCPKCGEEMEPGSLMIEPEGNGVYAKWYGKQDERSILGGEPIYKGKRYDRDWIDALRCHECNAVTLFLPRLKSKTYEEEFKARPPF